jgi:hypothetical protein
MDKIAPERWSESAKLEYTMQQDAAIKYYVTFIYNIKSV